MSLEMSSSSVGTQQSDIVAVKQREECEAEIQNIEGGSLPEEHVQEEKNRDVPASGTGPVVLIRGLFTPRSGHGHMRSRSLSRSRSPRPLTREEKTPPPVLHPSRRRARSRSRSASPRPLKRKGSAGKEHLRTSSV
jgi:hypothetical protein